MYARITTATISGEKRALQPESVDEALERWKNEVAHEIAEKEGFLEAIVLVCRKTNRIMQIGLWKTEEDMLAIEQDGSYRRLVGTFCDTIGHNPKKEYFEIGTSFRAVWTKSLNSPN